MGASVLSENPPTKTLASDFRCTQRFALISQKSRQISEATIEETSKLYISARHEQFPEASFRNAPESVVKWHLAVNMKRSFLPWLFYNIVQHAFVIKKIFVTACSPCQGF